MNKPASFIYKAERGRGNIVRLYRDGFDPHKLVVDIEGFPQLARKFSSPQQAVECFDGWRERSLKDWGASAVDWGDYAEYSQYWPEDATPWDVNI